MILENPLERVTRVAKYRFKVELANGQTVYFTEKKYAKWLREDAPCAVCGRKICSAHHEPPLGQGSKQRKFYWMKTLALCPECHDKRTAERLSKATVARLQLECVTKYPEAFIDWLGTFV